MIGGLLAARIVYAPHRHVARQINPLTLSLTLRRPADKSKKVQDFVKAVSATVKDGLERKAKAAFSPEQLEAEK